MPALLSPITLGELELPNRVIMAPLTRCRADNEGIVPNALMAEYYAQRASAGLILTEATVIDPMGIGYAHTPGIYSDAQIDGWKQVTDAVHARGGRIMLQLWHVGRISHPHFLHGETPVAPSAIKPSGHVSLLRPKTEFVTPRALELEEIPDIITAYKRAAENAKQAGFDGVEIHAANGYLLDQFLQDGTNQRRDAYGGSVENRARLILEVTDAILDVWSAGRVGVHLAPRGDMHDMRDSNPRETFGYLARELGKRKLAFIFTREHQAEDSLTPYLKQEFGGAMIANENFTQESAEATLATGNADAVAFGRLFIANPDLPERFANHAALNKPDMEHFYSGGAKGYTDYPRMQSKAA